MVVIKDSVEVLGGYRAQGSGSGRATEAGSQSGAAAPTQAGQGRAPALDDEYTDVLRWKSPGGHDVSR